MSTPSTVPTDVTPGAALNDLRTDARQPPTATGGPGAPSATEGREPTRVAHRPTTDEGEHQPPRALVRRARDGDPAAREELVRQVYPLVLRWTRARCRDGADAEDAAHDALVRVLRNLESFRGDARFTSWLYRVVRNVVLDRSDRRARRRAREEDLAALSGVAAGGPDPSDQAERSELLERVHTAFRALPDRQKEVFDMADLQGLTSPEIAERLGVAPSTVRVTLLHARRAVRSAVLGGGESPQAEHEEGR